VSRENDVHVYLISANGECGPVKVGIAKDVTKRIRNLQTACPYKLQLVHSFAFPNRDMAREIESSFHHVEAKHKTHGEWFAFRSMEALCIMCLCLEAVFEVRMPDYQELPLIKRLCGLTDAWEKIKTVQASREVMQ